MVANLPSGNFMLWLKSDIGVTGGRQQQRHSSGATCPAAATRRRRTDSNSYPTYVTGAINGIPVIHFNGSTSRICAACCSSQPDRDFSCYVIAQATAAQVKPANGGIGDRIFSCPTLTNNDYDQGLAIECRQRQRVPAANLQT